MDKGRFSNDYSKAKEAKDLPWSRGNPIKYLAKLTEQREKPGRALDIGCGAGIDSVHLAKLGWDVTSLDFMEEAINMTKQHAEHENVELNTVVADVTQWQPEGQFDLIVDSGLLHNLSRDHIGLYRANILSWLKPDADFVLAHWQSISSRDRLLAGPRRASREEITHLLSPELKAVKFDNMERYHPEKSFAPNLPFVSIGFYWFKRAEDQKICPYAYGA